MRYIYRGFKPAKTTAGKDSRGTKGSNEFNPPTEKTAIRAVGIKNHNPMSIPILLGDLA